MMFLNTHIFSANYSQCHICYSISDATDDQMLCTVKNMSIPNVCTNNQCFELSLNATL